MKQIKIRPTFLTMWGLFLPSGKKLLKKQKNTEYILMKRALLKKNSRLTIKLLCPNGLSFRYKIKKIGKDLRNG